MNMGGYSSDARQSGQRHVEQTDKCLDFAITRSDNARYDRANDQTQSGGGSRGRTLDEDTRTGHGRMRHSGAGHADDGREGGHQR